jgi:peptidyl-prolyl cis-trans isomerase SurA
MVMNDYQSAIEDKWIAQLKKKYPVKVNQEVWKDVRGDGK